MVDIWNTCFNKPTTTADIIHYSYCYFSIIQKIHTFSLYVYFKNYESFFVGPSCYGKPCKRHLSDFALKLKYIQYFQIKKQTSVYVISNGFQMMAISISVETPLSDLLKWLISFLQTSNSCNFCIGSDKRLKRHRSKYYYYPVSLHNSTLKIKFFTPYLQGGIYDFSALQFQHDHYRQ